jgi:glycosyltransferase involved in cell wall biosynthesis
VTPRVLFVSRGRIQLPLAPWLARKWDALSEVFVVRALNAGSGAEDRRFHLLPEPSWIFFPILPVEIARELRAHPADAIVASDPYVAAAALTGRKLARSQAKVIVELHGDPRTFTRLYGSQARRTIASVADATAKLALRRADATRAVSSYTGRLVEEARGRPPTKTFLAYSDLSAFSDTPAVAVPTERRIVFVGALEPYKNIDGLAQAWRRVASEMPDAVLVIVGRGSRHAVVEALVRDLPRQVVHHPELPPAGVARELDNARALVLPSFPEGLGRVVLEAFARARGVVGTDGGGIPDMVTHESDGLLIPPYDTDALVAALARVLDDHELCVRLGTTARETYRKWHQTPEGFAGSYRDLIDCVLAGGR